MLILAAVMWSMSGIFAKAPWLEAWPIESRGMLLAFWRTLFAGLFLLPLIRRPQWSWRLVPTTLIFAAMNVTFLTAMARTSAANAIWLQNTAPVWVIAHSIIFLKTRLSQREIAMAFFASAGVGVILLFEFSTADQLSRNGVVWGIFGGVAFAAVVISLRWVRNLEPAWVVVANHLVTAALLSPVVISEGIYPSSSQTLWLICFGVIQLGLPYILFARALHHVPSHEASFIVLLEPLLVPIWVYLMWSHRESYQAPSWWTLVGGGLILAGLLVLYVQPTQSKL